MSKVVGLDGCPDGWIAAVIEDGRLACFEFHEAARAALDAHPGAAVFAFDIPVGLSAGGRREADEAARRFLRGRASSVFNAPPRLVLDIASSAVGAKSRAEAYAEANEATRQVSGRGLFSQSFALAMKITDVDLVSGDPRVFEAHPEVTFAELSNRETLDGEQRAALHEPIPRLLAGEQPSAPDVVGDVSAKAAADDIVDAVACAWTAGRIAVGAARSLPDPPERIDGREVAIWC